MLKRPSTSLLDYKRSTLRVLLPTRLCRNATAAKPSYPRHLILPILPSFLIVFTIFLFNFIFIFFKITIRLLRLHSSPDKIKFVCKNQMFSTVFILNKPELLFQIFDNFEKLLQNIWPSLSNLYLVPYFGYIRFNPIIYLFF